MLLLLKKTIRTGFEILITPLLIVGAIISRFSRRPIDVGIGPEPIISHIYHKKAFLAYGYTAETFVSDLYFITQDFDKKMLPHGTFSKLFINIFRPLFFYVIFRYKCLYFYFNGGTLCNSIILWRLEPFLYRLAGIKIVVMPYGGDIQDLTRCPNLLYKHCMSIDYPIYRHRRLAIEKKIDLWLRYADHVIAGCDWVDYLYFWNTLLLTHFPIDTDKLKSIPSRATGSSGRPLRIFHAPNHRTIKGSRYFIDAVKELQAAGMAVELVMLEKVPNEKILETMAEVDIVADQLVIGWYAMFAIEAMAMGKPVLCYLREDLLKFYIDVGILKEGEIPIINCTPQTVKQVISDLVLNREKLISAGERSRSFVEKFHSIDAIGETFDQINRSLSLFPSQANKLK